MSRWGNFLQGIESGLDKILAEDASDNKHTTSQSRAEKISSTANISRQNSGRKRPGRLQEKFAKAVDTPNGEVRQTSKIGEFPSEINEELASRESEIEEAEPPVNGKERGASSNAAGQERTSVSFQTEPTPDRKRTSDNTAFHAMLTESTADATNNESVSFPSHGKEDNRETEGLNEAYLLERVEALQAKLDVFIREASEKAQAAKTVAHSAESSETYRVAALEEKVAALMAEGQNLSQKELKYLATIRRLHGRINEASTILTKEKKANANAERMIQSLTLKVENLQSAQREATDFENSKALGKHLEDARRQIDAQTLELSGLRRDVEEARSADLQDRLRKVEQDLDLERRTASDLRDKIENLKIERELETRRLKSQMEDAKREINQEKDRVVLRENELQNEITSLESRIEAIRSRNEETTGGTSDGKAKQLRQIEALQRQYSVSKENWGGIEASLNSRLASLEGERDELLRKDADLRRKLRNSMVSARRREEEAEELRSLTQSLEDRLLVEENTAKDAREALDSARDDLLQVQADHIKVKNELAASRSLLAARIEASEAGVDFAASDALGLHDRSMSPSVQRKATAPSDMREKKQAAGLGLLPSNGLTNERPTSSRKKSLASPHLSSHRSFRQHSTTSLTRSSSRSAIQEAPSVSADDEPDQFDDLATPVTPGRAYGDVFATSASTSAAGPSVQLVERMSSAVRRLESEKAAMRDELERTSAEREEARKQMISLMEEVESKRKIQGRVLDLEREVSETAQRYQTTLEILGEKSEQVEELRADIADMKQIYREALEKSLRQ